MSILQERIDRLREALESLPGKSLQVRVWENRLSTVVAQVWSPDWELSGSVELLGQVWDHLLKVIPGDQSWIKYVFVQPFEVQELLVSGVKHNLTFDDVEDTTTVHFYHLTMQDSVAHAKVKGGEVVSVHVREEAPQPAMAYYNALQVALREERISL